MTEKRFTKYVPDSYGYTYITTIIDNEKNKQTGNIDEIVDMLNEQHETIQRQSMIIQRQEMALSNMNNSRYKCAFCGAVGFLTETFQRLIE